MLLALTPFVIRIADYFVWEVYFDVMAVDATSRGFSGIVSAFGGLLLAGTGLFVADAYDSLTAWHTSMAIVLVSLGVLTVSFDVFSPLVLGLLFLGIVALATYFLSRDDLYEPAQLQSKITDHRQEILYVVGCGLIISIFMTFVFPPDITKNGMLVNVVSHGAGFTVGLFLTIIIDQVFTYIS